MSNDFYSVGDTWAKRREKRRQDANEALAVTLDKLSDLSITEVIVPYSGYDDSGSIYNNGIEIIGDITEINDEMLNIIIDGVYEFLPSGWEINEGSSGRAIINVTERKLIIEHGWNVVQTEYEELNYDL